ncbi:hypothetical protein Tco_0273810 [Tanacetum coccineum]
MVGATMGCHFLCGLLKALFLLLSSFFSGDNDVTDGAESSGGGFLRAIHEQGVSRGAPGRASPQLCGNFEHNVAAQVLNHDFFWESKQSGGGNLPTLGLMQQIENDFGS